jgi:hypothetical protein
MKIERIVWIVIILLIGGWLVHREITHKSKERGLVTMMEVLNDTIKTHRNDKGQWEAEKKSFNLTTEELKKYGQDLNLENVNLKKRVGNLNNLVGHLQGELVASGEGEVQLVIANPNDSIATDSLVIANNFSGHVFDWTNNFLTLHGTLSDTYKLNFNYTYQSGFEVTTYWKRPKMFKRKDLIVNFTSHDPNAQAMNLTSVVVKPDRPKFYDTHWFWGGLGVIGGFLLGSR